MRKLFFLITLFLCSFSIANNSHAEILNWCGTYVEKNNHGFIVISQADIAKGSKNCSVESYRDSVDSIGYRTVLLDFNNRSKVNHWRKFDSHVIEIRGKLYQNKITNARFVRDYGA